MLSGFTELLCLLLLLQLSDPRYKCTRILTCASWLVIYIATVCSIAIYWLMVIILRITHFLSITNSCAGSLLPVPKHFLVLQPCSSTILYTIILLRALYQACQPR